MATDKDSKTEDPTGKRKSDAQEKGDVPRSKDMGATASLLFTLFFFVFFIPYFSRTTIKFWRKYFSMVGDFSITELSMSIVGRDFFFTFLNLVVPLFMVLFVSAVMMEVLQSGGIKIISQNISIKWEKVFFWTQIPKGLKKVIGSVQAMAELVKSIVKVFIIGAIAYYSIIGDIPELLSLPVKPLNDILNFMGRLFLKLTFNIIVFLVILSVADFLWQKYQYTKKLKMSKQDIKDEYKQMEGDPKVKGKQKQIQFQWAMQRMMQEVPKADVIITNPTHYAVALKYEIKKMVSPKLLAKGKNLIAENIKKVARENGIPIVENPPVARALFSNVEIGEFIPEQMFKAVAEILAYIYKLKGKRLG